MSCNLCRWFESREIKPRLSMTGRKYEILVGNCRRHPPQRMSFPDTEDVTSGWPKTSGHDWCGEWEKMLDDIPNRGSATGKGPGRRWTDWVDDQEQIQEVEVE